MSTFAVKWIGPHDDGKIWFVREIQTDRPRFYEATWSADRGDAYPFPTMEEARSVAKRWGSKAEVVPLSSAGDPLPSRS